jgi:hypothetical protein
LTVDHPIINFYRIEYIEPFIPIPIFNAKKIYFTECKTDFLTKTININMFPYVEKIDLINTIGIIPEKFFYLKTIKRDCKFSDPSKIKIKVYNVISYKKIFDIL